MEIKEFKNIFLGILSFIIVWGAVRLTGITIETGQWMIILFLILIYFELIDLNKKNRN